jgi:energy-coupling factor transporter ATP-binding protein EcfA2
MQLVNARVTYYRSAEDSEEWAVEPDVTCLVGKNESGKTNLAQALFRLNPMEPAAFDEIVDFPARMTARRKNFKADETIPVVGATFRYDDSEIADIEADLGPGALTSPELTVTAGYRSSAPTLSHQYDEAAIVRHLRAELDLGAAAAQVVESASDIAGLLKALEELPELTSATQDLVKRINGWRQHRVACYLVEEYAWPRMPKFVYFAEYDAMPGKVSISDLIRRRGEGALTRGERALLALLDLASVSLEDFNQTDQHERLIRELENASNVISDEVFEYWTQNQDLSVKLSTHPPESGARAPLDHGPVLFVQVENHRHRVTVPFDERSRGFVWFFSFVAYFSKIEEGRTSNLILLLDEPGLSLHARAQQDLLRLINERLAPHHQVIYTTHWPFMVSSDRFHRVRTVIDHEKAWSKVSAEIFKADDDTAFPLLTAMGIEMTQTLFIGEHTLLLEGPSDLIYLDVLTDLAEGRQQPGLDPRWVKTPIGGSGKLSTFVTLLGANKLHVAVLIDSSTKETGAVRRLRDNGQLARNGLVEISEFTPPPT